MRIIAGEFRSRVIQAPEGMQTRPTRDFVREALFNMLMGRCEGARALDLFAGSGALALEALSRGAVFAALCDLSSGAIGKIRQNIASLRVEDRTRVIQGDWRDALSTLSDNGARYTLVFLDPPYAMELAPVLNALDQSKLLSPGALIAAEQDKNASLSAGEHYSVIKQRDYRDTRVTLLNWEGLK